MNDNNDDMYNMYDRCDKAYENYLMDKYYDEKYCKNKSYDDIDGYDGAIQKFKNYEELLSLTEQEDTKDKLKNIGFALIKAVVKLRCKEVSFKFDFKLGPYESWIDIAEYFNSNYVGKDYRIIIDEDAIVCKLLNEKLIA